MQGASQPNIFICDAIDTASVKNASSFFFIGNAAINVIAIIYLNYAYVFFYSGYKIYIYLNMSVFICRNNEKRKEKSRDAARCRRSRETEIFTDLANVLPARRDEVEQLDKASIMRLSIAYLKVRGMLNLCKFQLLYFVFFDVN